MQKFHQIWTGGGVWTIDVIVVPTQVQNKGKQKTQVETKKNTSKN